MADPVEASARKRQPPPVAVAPVGSIAVSPGDEFRLALAPVVLGQSVKACEMKIQRGEWVEGRQYHRAPDGTIWLSRKGVSAWVRGE